MDPGHRGWRDGDGRKGEGEKGGAEKEKGVSEKGGERRKNKTALYPSFFLYILLHPLSMIMSRCTLYTPTLQDKSLQIIIWTTVDSPCTGGHQLTSRSKGYHQQLFIYCILRFGKFNHSTVKINGVWWSAFTSWCCHVGQQANAWVLFIS